MQVNKDRFPAVLPHFLELLETCAFYAFDEEMTGINVPEVVESVTFSPEESYHSKRLAASRYNMIQVGICLFHREEVAGRPQPHCYTARPFNFILFPGWTDELSQLQLSAGATAGEVVGQRDVVLSPSALSFLRRHGMDFQRWVYEGIGLCDSGEERLLLRCLAEKYKAGDGDEGGVAEREEGEEEAAALPVFFTDEEKAWVAESIAAGEALVKRVAEAEATPAVALQAVSREVMLTPQSSRHAREYLREYARKRLPSLTVSFRRPGGQGLTTTTTLVALTAAEVMQRAAKEAQLRMRERVDLVGFRLVFAALVASGKPCVGHNCFADMLFLMAALDQPLPGTLREWKARVHALFPRVYDTKYLVSRRDLFPAGRFSVNYLGGFFEQYGFVSPRVRVTLPMGFEAYDPVALLGGGRRGGGGGGGPAHEAAFDALMTGTLLLNLLAEVGRLGDDGAAVGEEAALVNKVALFRSLYAVDLQEPERDEYLPEGSASVVVLDVAHDPAVKAAQLEGLLLQTAAVSSPPVLYSVVAAPPSSSSSCSSCRTLAVVDLLSPSCSAAALAEKLALRFPSLLHSVSPYAAPHHQQQRRKAADAAFCFPPALGERALLLLRSALPRK